MKYRRCLNYNFLRTTKKYLLGVKMHKYVFESVPEYRVASTGLDSKIWDGHGTLHRDYNIDKTTYNDLVTRK